MIADGFKVRARVECEQYGCVESEEYWANLSADRALGETVLTGICLPNGWGLHQPGYGSPAETRCPKCLARSRGGL